MHQKLPRTYGEYTPISYYVSFPLNIRWTYGGHTTNIRQYDMSVSHQNTTNIRQTYGRHTADIQQISALSENLEAGEDPFNVLDVGPAIHDPVEPSLTFPPLQLPHRNRIALIWLEPEPEPETARHPMKLAGFLTGFAISRSVVLATTVPLKFAI